MKISIELRTAQDVPEFGKPVLAIVEHWYTKGHRYAVLKSVQEDDCNYRTVDDDSELSFDWTVLAWDYLPELKSKE